MKSLSGYSGWGRRRNKPASREIKAVEITAVGANTAPVDKPRDRRGFLEACRARRLNVFE